MTHHALSTSAPRRQNHGITRSFIASLSRNLALATLAALGLSRADATSYYWDPLVDGNGVLGGTGTWNLTSNFWDLTGTDPVTLDNIPWPNLATDTAVFGGTAGTVTINTGSGITTNALTFNSDGYLIKSNVAADVLTLGGTTPTITVTNAGQTATISSNIAGTNGLTLAGAGTLILSGTSTYTGGTIIGGGSTLQLNVTGSSSTVTGTGVTTAAPNNPVGSGALTLSAGATLNLNPVATTTTNGLSGRQFNAAATNNDTSNVDFTATANSTRYDANLNRFDLTTASGGGTVIAPTTNTTIQWTGKLQITNAGSYRFYTASDDGSRVFIDGVLVVNNDGSKGTTDLGSAAVSLSAGLHDIRIDYAQGGGGGSEILSWSGGTGLDVGATETAIPSSALFTAESNSTTGSSNAVVIGAGTGDAVSVQGDSTINLNGTNFTQAQVGGLTNTTNSILTINGTAGKTLRFAGATTVTGTLTLNATPNVAFDGVLAGTGATIVKQGAGRLTFDQTAAANTITGTIDVQGGTLVLVGGTNNPIGTASVQLSGGNMVLDSKSGARTFDNVITVNQSATIQDIVAGVGPLVTTLGSATRGISIASGQTLTLDAIYGGNNLANNPTASTEAGAQITVAGAITGGGNLQVISSSFGNSVVPGVIALTNGTNTFSGAITLNGTTITTNTLVPLNGPTLRPTVAGALPNGAGNALFIKSGTLDLATNNIAYTPNAANVLTMGAGPATTTSNINIGTGALSLTNDLVFDATNNGGTATIKGNGATTGILDLNTAGLRTINVGDSANANFDMVIAAVIAGTGGGGFVKTGAGTLAIQANVTAAAQANTYTGLTEVAQGTLYVGGVVGGGVAFNNAAITGNIQIDAGATFRHGAGNIIADVTPIVTVNGTWDLNGFGETTGSAAGNGVITAGAPSNLRFDLANNAFTFSGSFTGQVTLGLSGRNSTAPVTVPTSQFALLNYFGNTIVGDQNAGATTSSTITLQLSSNNALPFGFGRGDLVVGSGATGTNKGVFDLNGFSQTVNGLTSAGALSPTVTNNSATADSTLTVGATGLVTSTNTFGGLIADGPTNKIHFTKIGLGTQVLSSANTYTGVTTINNGKLSITNASALGAAGSSTNGTVVNSGGYLDVGAAGLTVNELLTLNGRGQPLAASTGTGGSGYTGALQASTGTTSVWAGNITLGSDSAIGVVKGAALTISGSIGDGGSGFGLTKLQGDGIPGGAPATIGVGGTLVFTGVNTYTGATTIEGGEIRLQSAGQAIASTVVNIGDMSNNGATLTLGGNNQMPSNVVLNFNNGNQNAKFQLNGFNQTVAGFTSSGTLPIIQNFETGGAGTSTLTVSNTANTSFNGYMRDQTGTLALTKTGTGTLTLSGQGATDTTARVAYTGATAVVGGKLLLQDTTGFNSAITLSGTSSLEVNLSYGRTLTYAKALVDNGLGFTKSGKGNLVFGTAASTVTGQVNVSEGSLILAPVANASPLAGATINVSAGAQLDLYGVAGTSTYNNNVILNGMSNGGALAGAVIGGTLTNNLTGTVTLNATSNITTGWSDKSLTISGAIGGSGGLVLEKMLYTQNQPIFNLANATNTFAGDLTIRAGTVYSGGNGSLGGGNLTFGGYYQTVNSSATAFGAPSGGLVLGTGGISGGFTRALGTGAGQVQFTDEGGGFSAVGGAQTVNFGGGGSVDWGAAGFSANAGLFFNASNSLGGATAYNADSQVNVLNDFVLSSAGYRRIFVFDNNGSTNDKVNFSGAISGAGGILKDGVNSAGGTNNQGTLILSGTTANTYTGLTTVIAGVLALNKSAGTTAIGGDLQIGGLQNNGTRRIVYLGANEQIPDTATVTLIGSSGNNGDLRLFGFNETIGALNDRSGGSVVEVGEVSDPGFGTAISASAASTLTIAGNSDSFFNGFLRNNGTGSGAGTGALSLVKNGSGTLTLSTGQQTFSNATSMAYSGTTTINGGMLVFSNINPTVTGVAATTLNSAITVNAGAKVGFNNNINGSFTEGQVISGAGELVKTGSGTVILSGANAYSGATTVNGGTLNITGTTNAAHTGTYTVNSGGTLLIGNGTTGGALTANNAITVNANGTLAFSRNNGYTFSGIISGAGNVESRAGGTATILSGANTYSGTTTVLSNAALRVAGNGISADGLIVNSGGTLNLDFTLAGANAAGIAASTAPVTLNGGTLTITGSAVANTQALGAVLLSPNSLVNGGGAASTINLTSGAGGLAASFGQFSHTTGGTANIVLPTLGTASSSGTAVGGLLSGFTTTNSGATWVAQDGTGLLSALSAYDVDLYGAGKNTDVTVSGAGGNTNSLRFNIAAPTTVTLSGTNTIDSGGILMTSAVGNNASVITGGTLAGSSSAGLTVIQGNTSNSLTISSIVADNGGATGLTKAGAGTLILSGANTYAGPTYVGAGTLITNGTTGSGIATVAQGATLQIGDGTTNGIIPTIFNSGTGTNNGVVSINNVSAQTLPIYQAASTFNFIANAASNPTSLFFGTLQKTGTGTLTINNPLLTNSFHARNGLTILDTGANVQSSAFSDVASQGTDVATLTIKGAARLTASADFNISDASGSRGTLNIQDQAQVTPGNFLVGKTGTSVGVVNQTFGNITQTASGNDWRVGGNGTAGSDTGAYGIYNLSAGSFQTNRNLQLGASGIGVFNQTGGTVTITGGTPSVGRFASGGTGLLAISNGTFSHTTTTNVVAGENGVGVINVGGSGQLIFTNVATANAGLAMGGAGGDGTVNLLSGGLIITGQVRDFDASTATASKFNFNGGTLRVQTGTVNAATFMTGLTSATVYSGGANIDTNGVATTIAQALTAPVDSGLTSLTLGGGGSGYVGEPIVSITGGGGSGATARAIVSAGVVTGFTITSPGSGYTSAPTVTLLGGGAASAATASANIGANAITGGLTKLNTGVLTLTGTNTYGGPTTITGGSITESFSTVGGTNILPATGLVINGGGLTATGFAAGTNTQAFSGTTVSGVGTIVSNIGTSGTMAVSLGALAPTAGGAVDFSGTGTITTTSLNTGTSILGGWATFGAGAGWAVSAGDGTNPGLISALGSYTNDTWAAGNNTTVTTSSTTAALATNSLRFNAAAGATVTLSGANVITTGGILVTPTVANNAVIITGGTSLASGGTNTDLVVNQFNTANTLAINSVIAANGTGGLVKAGGGVLTLGAANTYAGNTTIGAGTLRLGIATGIPSGAGKGDVNISAGATLDLNQFSPIINGLSGYGTVTVQTAPGTATTYTLTEGSSGTSTTFSGVINNNGNATIALTKTGAGTLTLNNIAAGTYTGATTISVGAIKIATPQALSNNTQIVVNAANGLLFDTTVPVISGLAGSQTFALQTTATSPLPNAPVQLTVGNNNAGGTYSGILTGSGTIIKIGTGTETLSGANTFSGGVVANGGILELSGNNSGASGSVFVNSGGTVQLKAANSFLGSSGRNVVVASGGVLTLGSITANSASTGFGAITPVLARIDLNSTGVLALQTDGTLQTPISENLDFSNSAALSLGSAITAASGFGNAPVQYTGIITPNGNTFRVGGGTGRLILPNGATFSGANNMLLYGGGSTGGFVFLTGNYGYTGSTLVNGGNTYVTNVANGGVASSFGASSNAASNLVLNGGTLTYIGAGGSTDRLFTLSAAPTILDASGAGALNFTNTGAVGFLNSGNRLFTLQGSNTGANTLAAAIGDSINQAGATGSTANGLTSLLKAGNGTWFLSGSNTFSGGITINNGVLGFNSTASIGGNTVNGPASVLVNAGGAAAFGSSFTGNVQTALQRISPLSTGSVALTADTNENLSFDGGANGATLPQVSLGAYGKVTYTGTLTPFGGAYRLGGGGGVLTMPNGGLTGPRQVIIGGGGPGAGFVNNPNLNGAVVLGGTSDYTGGTVLNTGSILSATSVQALGTGPLKFLGGVYRAIDSTDITLASDGVSARDIRFGNEASAQQALVNVDVANGISVTFSKTFGALPTYGSNEGVTTGSPPPPQTFTKYGAGTLVLAQGINLATSAAASTSNSGTLTIERGTVSIQSNPTFFNGLIQVGSNSGGVGTLKLGGNNVFGTGTVFAGGSIVDVYSGSKIDLNGFSDTLRLVRGMGGIVNTGAPGATLTVGTNNEQGVLAGNLVGDFTLIQGGNVFNTLGASGNAAGLELWNNYNSNFVGKLVANAGALRIRSDGTLGSTTEPFKADKITLNNGAVLISATTVANGNAGFVPIVIGANHGITLGSGGGTLAGPNNSALIVNSPVTGSGKLIIGDETGAVYLANDNNSYTGGTTLNASAANRGILVIGAGGTGGSLPAGDVFFNGAAAASRIAFFKSGNMTLANNFVGQGQIYQFGAGTTTLTGMNSTGQGTFIGGGRLKADFSAGSTPIGTGTGLQISAGAFEYVGATGDNALRLGTLTSTVIAAPANNGTGIFTGGFLGDGTVQSTYGGSGNQSLIFSGIARGTAGITTNFVVSGGSNGTTNSIRFSAGPTVNNVIGASYFFGGSEFAALDSQGFVRAPIFGADANTAPLNTLSNGKYSKLTTSLINQGPVTAAGIELSGDGTNLIFANSGNTAAPLIMNGNPAAILKSGGGTSVLGGGTMAQTISPQVTTTAALSNNGQELIVRTDTASDVLQIDLAITGAGALTKSGNGILSLTAANTYTGNTLINSGTVNLNGNGTLGSGTAGTSVRIANAAGSVATVNMNSASSVITAGLSTQGDALRIGEMGTGTLNQTAGTVNANQFVTIGDNLGAVGTYNMSGGTLNVKNNNSQTPAFVVGRAGTGTFSMSGSSVVNVKNGAQVLLGSGVPTGSAVLAQSALANVGVSTGVGTITQSGGTFTVDTNVSFQNAQYGGVFLGVDGAGTYNLNGGTLITPIIARGNGTANFNLGGGTLKAPTPVANIQASLLNVDLPVNLTGIGGKGTFDTNGNDVSITGSMTGSGGIIKASAGALNMLGKANNYAGGTDINAGSVVASGTALGTGVVNIGAGGTLQVQGVQQGLFAKFQVTNGTSIVPNNSATGATAQMYPEFSTLESFLAFSDGKATVAVESTAARGKTSVDYLDLGGSNQNTALPPAVMALGNGSNPFIANLSGKFTASATGDYTFQTRSDDASMVWIDGQPVLDNNRGQGQTVRTGTISLTAGQHDIVIGYAQGSGGGGFSVGVTQASQGQSYLLGSELNMSNSLLSYGSNDLSVGGLSGAGAVQMAAGNITVDTANGTNVNFAGVLNGVSGSGLIKQGLGTQILSGNNAATFSGPTSVLGGMLIVNGSLSGSAVTVGSAGTLGGTGAVGTVAVNASGVLAPGTLGTAGTLSSSSVSLSANSIFSVDIGATTVGSYDSLNVTGSISLSGSTLSLDTIGGFANNPGDTFYVMLNNGADPVTGIFGNDIGGSVTSIDGYVFNVNYAANAPGGDGGSNDVALTLMAVPEPGSAALLLGGLAALTLRRRRKA